MTVILLKTWCSDYEACDVPEFAVLTVTSKVAHELLRRMEVTKKLQATESVLSLLYIGWVSHDDLTWYSYFDPDIEELLDKHEAVIHADPLPDDVKEDDIVRGDCTVMRVYPNVITWYSTIKHTSIDMWSGMLTETLLRRLLEEPA